MENYLQIGNKYKRNRVNRKSIPPKHAIIQTTIQLHWDHFSNTNNPVRQAFDGVLFFSGMKTGLNRSWILVCFKTLETFIGNKGKKTEILT